MKPNLGPKPIAVVVDDLERRIQNNTDDDGNPGYSVLVPVYDLERLIDSWKSIQWKSIKLT